ncbi:PepSY domain-containing protein [Parahaliea mediterranea]|uniref:PepSY domain-containing protein n=1 Tax=Parahaliea mediterranea TaxID=651086 RepID=UPI00130069F1|nr:PepSY domain-containing protein [Parahaliea mediterranea]
MNRLSMGIGALAAAIVAAPLLAGSDPEEAAVALYAIERSGVTLDKALAQAEQAVPGIAYEYELEDDDGQLFHEIKVMDLEGEVRHKLRIAVADGSLSQKQEPRSCAVVCRDDEVLAARALQDAGYSLRRAIAEGGAGTKQLLEEAEVELERGVRYFKLEWVGPEGERDQLIDIDNGQTIPSLTSPGG